MTQWGLITFDLVSQKFEEMYGEAPDYLDDAMFVYKAGERFSWYSGEWEFFVQRRCSKCEQFQWSKTFTDRTGCDYQIEHFEIADPCNCDNIQWSL